MVQKSDPWNTALFEIEDIKKIAMSLMETKHYSRLGAEGIFAIVQKAKSLNIHPLEALNGGLYFVQGKVEISAQMMNQLIRQAGHSISKDPKSDDTICILHGKRCDTGDNWTESFSIEDAKRAGIYKINSPWTKFPRNMLFARALSNLARQLFPDAIKNCYVEGEIRDSVPFEANDTQTIVEKPNMEQVEKLRQLLDQDEDYKRRVMDKLQKEGIADLEELSTNLYNRILKAAEKRMNDKPIDMPVKEENSSEVKSVSFGGI